MTHAILARPPYGGEVLRVRGLYAMLADCVSDHFLCDGPHEYQKFAQTAGYAKISKRNRECEKPVDLKLSVPTSRNHEVTEVTGETISDCTSSHPLLPRRTYPVHLRTLLV